LRWVTASGGPTLDPVELWSKFLTMIEIEDVDTDLRAILKEFQGFAMEGIPAHWC